MSNPIAPELPKILHPAETYYTDHPEAKGSFLEDTVPHDVKYQIFSHLPVTDMINVFCLNKHFKALFFPDLKTKEGQEIIKEQGYRQHMCKFINHVNVLDFREKTINILVETASAIFTKIPKENIKAFYTDIQRFITPLFEQVHEASFNDFFQEPNLKNSDLLKLFKLCRSPLKGVLENILLKQIKRGGEFFNQELIKLRSNQEYCQQVETSCKKLELDFNILDLRHDFKKEKPEASNSFELPLDLLARVDETKTQSQVENGQKAQKSNQGTNSIRNYALLFIIGFLSVAIFRTLKDRYDF